MKRSFFARRSFLIILVMVFLMPLIGMGTRRALQSNRNDVKDWLPANFPETKTHRWFQAHFPHEQFVLVSWEGCTLDDPRLEMLAQKLETFDPNLQELGITGRLAKRLDAAGLHSRRAIEGCANLQAVGGLGPAKAAEVLKVTRAWASPFKAPVLTGRRLVDRLENSLELPREDALKRLEGSLIGEDHEKTCLVVSLSKAAEGKNLRRALESILRVAGEGCGIGREEIRMGGPPVDNVAIDVEGEKTLYRLAGLAGVVGLGISWLCFRDYRLTFLVFIIGILSAGVGLASVYYAGLLAQFLGHEWFALTYGTCDAILLSMPSLVYILAIAGAIHIINYYHDAIREGGLERAPERALKHGLAPCALSTLTTALGLGSLIAGDLVPITKFGIYSAWGVMATLLLLFLYLPACLHYFPSRDQVKAPAKHAEDQPNPSALFTRFWHAVGKFITRYNLPVTAGCLLIMGLLILGLCGSERLGLPGIQTSVKLMKLFSPDAQIIHDYAWLEEQLGPLVPMEIVIRVDNQKCKLSMIERMRLAQQVERAVQRLGDVGGTLSAATFAPNITRDTRKGGLERIIGLNRDRERDRQLSRILQRHREDFREYLTVDKDAAVADQQSDPHLGQLGINGELAELLEAHNLASLQSIEHCGDLESIAGMGPERAAEVAQAIDAWRQAHHDPTLEELGITGELAQRLKAKNLASLLALEKYAGEGSIEEKLGSQRAIGPAQAAEVAQAVDRWRTTHGEELWRVSARVEALGDLDYGLFVDDIRNRVEPVLAAYRKTGVEGIDAVYTGLVPLVYKTQRQLLEGLFNSLKWAFVCIAVVMVIALRSPAAGLMSMLPNIFPVVLVFGAMSWLGIVVDVGTMMTASVGLGVADDELIHFLTWFRRGMDEGLDRKGAVMLAYERCGTAMTQTTLIGGLGLSVFAFSSFTPTQRFGVLMLALLAAGLLGDLILLPALLSGPAGRFFRAPKKKKRSAAPPAEEAADHSCGAVPAPDEEVVAVPMASTPAARRLRREPPHRSSKVS